MSRRKTISLRVPLMSAFRGAAQDRDARKTLDLRDESGDRVVASRRAVGRGAITETLLRREVARDLGQLLNSINLESSFALGHCEHVRRSVLNYGLPDVVNRTIDEVRLGDVVREIELALKLFEPRLVPGSIKVERDLSVDEVTLNVRFLVKADMVADPLNVPVEFIAEVQSDSGKFQVARL